MPPPHALAHARKAYEGTTRTERAACGMGFVATTGPEATCSSHKHSSSTRGSATAA